LVGLKDSKVLWCMPMVFKCPHPEVVE